MTDAIPDVTFLIYLVLGLALKVNCLASLPVASLLLVLALMSLFKALVMFKISVYQQTLIYVLTLVTGEIPSMHNRSTTSKNR